MAKQILSPDELSVACSWEVMNDRSIENALTLDLKDRETQKFDLESIVSLETCIELGNKDIDVPCIIEIKILPRNATLTEMTIVSEARIVEVYGQCGEYLATAHAQFIDDWEEMAVYMAEINIPQPSSECALKFARLRNKGRMWLYGIHITIDKQRSSSPVPEKTVNFQNVNKILKESSYQLTEKADKCKKFLQMYYSAYRDQSKMQNIPNPQALLKMFEAEYLAQCHPIGSHAKNMSKCLADLFPGISPKSRTECNDEKVNVTIPRDHSQDFSIMSDDIKCYIDQRFSELEKTILLGVDEKFHELQRKQNEKLDQILLLIQNLQFGGTSSKTVCAEH